MPPGFEVFVVARYRTYKPELFADEKLTECTVDARFLFLGLLPFLDDMGRRQYHPRRIKAEVFPADDEYTIDVVEGLVQELAKVGVIELYDIKGKHYLRVPNFLRHQYVKKPTHSYVPPSPSEGPNAVRCNCLSCKARSNRNSPHHPASEAVSDEFYVDSSTVPVGEYGTSSVPVGNKDGRSTVPVRNQWGQEVSKKGIGIGIVKGESQNQEQNQKQEQNQSQNPAFETTPENRRAQARALEEIAIRMLDLLQLEAKPLILEALTKSITIKARSKNCTYEAAAQQIAARAALVAVENPPEDWSLWFHDVRYEYLPQGDKRLDDRKIEARAVCGSTRCSEGWEPIRIGDCTVLRRCPDCVRLWEDTGS